MKRHSVRLFDHLVGEREQPIWHVEAERLGSTEIDDQVEFGRQLHRQVAGFLPFENPAGVDAGAAIGIRLAGSVAHQATGLGVLARHIARGQGVAGRKRVCLCGGPSADGSGGRDQKSRPRQARRLYSQGQVQHRRRQLGGNLDRARFYLTSAAPIHIRAQAQPRLMWSSHTSEFAVPCSLQALWCERNDT
jgi:hypothetical protein